MSLPMVISMLVNSLYNIIDSFFVAKISEDAMTSLSLVFPVQNFISATAIGFGIGINAMINSGACPFGFAWYCANDNMYTYNACISIYVHK